MNRFDKVSKQISKQGDLIKSRGFSNLVGEEQLPQQKGVKGGVKHIGMIKNSVSRNWKITMARVREARRAGV